MSYGNTFEDVKKELKTSEKVDKRYGIFISAVVQPEFSLFCGIIDGNNKEVNLNDFYEVNGGFLFVEQGKAELNDSNKKLILEQGEVLKIPQDFSRKERIFFSPEKGSHLYFFSSPKFSSENRELVKRKTFDVRNKYWGKIETILNNETYSGKRIFMRQGKQSSLEYHVNKKEAYYLQEGRLKVGLRVGRAENKSVILNPGDSFVMYPGTMHMRIALEDSVIFEISTHDDDKDSRIVEDGKKYVHKEI